MKKFLFTMGLVSLVLFGSSQTVLNEVYTEPNGSTSEFFELYNSAISSQDVDCFTVVTYWEGAGGTRGVYVMDLPNLVIGPKGFFVGSSANPFDVQSLTGVTTNVNWNDVSFRNGSTGGYLKKYQVNPAGTAFTDLLLPDATSVIDLLADVSPAGASGHNYFTFVFVNGVFNNGFWGGGPNGNLPVGITNLPDLLVTPAGSCGAAFTIDFSTFGAVEFVNSAPGSDNGYARTSDGKCGAWEKTSAGIQHTPKSTNGSAAGLSGALTTAQFISCVPPPGARFAQFDITAISGSATEIDDFPVQIFVYNDANHNQILDGSDVIIGTKTQATVAASADTVQMTGTNKNADVIFVYKTKRGCFDRVVAVVTSCIPLPVDFKSFTAVRSLSNVLLKWTTASEQNSDVFVVERNIGSGWQQVTAIPTQAPGGNSSSLLTYQFIDVNTTKGVTQYRIRQVDLNAQYKFSDIRAVRGADQKSRIIVYPNPSTNGKVNVIFEDVEGIRDVTLMDLSGKIVKQWKGVTTNNIQAENLVSGMYSLRVVIRETGEQSVEKIVVNKR